MAEKVVFRRRPGLKLEVYDNRIEVTEGLIPFRKKKVIPFRSISSVDVASMTKRLVIETNDGDDYKYSLGYLTGRKANQAKQAIAERL